MNIVKILIIVTTVQAYEGGNHPTGLWLSELTHLYHEAKERGYEVTIIGTLFSKRARELQELLPRCI